MVFSMHATDYTTLTSRKSELTTSKSHPLIKNTDSIRCKMSRIFKKLVNNDTHLYGTIKSEIKESTQLCKGDIHVSEKMKNDNDTTKTTILKNSNNDKNSNPIKTVSDSSKSMTFSQQLSERLPFTEPYFSMTPTDEKQYPIALSAYHKHCIRQEKCIDQKQYHHDVLSVKQTTFSKQNSSISTSNNKKCLDSVHHELEKQEKANQMKVNSAKRTSSSTTLPISTSIENRIGLEYASRRNTITNNRNVRSSFAPQYLRRLQSKPKMRPLLNEMKTVSLGSQNICSPSFSIAHRIELLKKAMHNNQLEFHHSKSDKTSPIELSSHPFIDTLNKETQTNNNHLNSSEFHHIHYHHIHSSSCLPIDWRIFFSMMGTVSIIFLLFIELISIIF